MATYSVHFRLLSEPCLEETGRFLNAAGPRKYLACLATSSVPNLPSSRHTSNSLHHPWRFHADKGTDRQTSVLRSIHHPLNQERGGRPIQFVELGNIGA